MRRQRYYPRVAWFFVKLTCAFGLLCSGLLLAACSDEQSAGSLVVDESRDRSFRYEVYLPEAVGARPLVVFSHGSGGDYRSYTWVIQALVTNGYVVAAFNHPHNNALDNTNEGVLRVWDRPRDMSLVIDALLLDPKWSPRIDPDRIGAAGHSSGGYAAIALGGAVYNVELMRGYCMGSDRGLDCELADSEVVIDYSDASAVYADNRVKAILAMAPALGPAIEPDSLESIDVPVLIMTAKDDELLGLRRHAGYYAEHIPDAKMHVFPAGGHFLFMECDLVTRVADWFIDKLELCGTPFGVERAPIQDEAAGLLIEFFNGMNGAR